MARHRNRADLHGFGVSACATCDGVLLSQQGCHRRRRWQLRRGGSTLISPIWRKTVTVVHRRGCFPRGKDPAGAPFRKAETSSGDLGPRGSGISRDACKAADAGLGQRREASQHQDRGNIRHGHRRCFSSRSVMRLRSSSSRANFARSERVIFGLRRIPPRPTSRASFAAGNVTDDIYRQAVTAAGMVAWLALERRNTWRVICPSQLQPNRSC